MSRTFLSESPYFQNNKSERFSRLRTLRSRKKRLMGEFSQTLKFKPVTLDFDAREPGTIKATNFAKEKSASTLQPLFSAKKKTLRACHSEFLSFVPGLQIIGTQKKLLHDAGFALLCLQRPWQDFWALDYSWLQLFSQDWITGLFFSKPFRMKQKPVWSETATFNFNLL